MPRSGGGAYTLPANYEAVAGETILASQHNDPLEDLETDANTARPIVAGGTNASTAVGGADNLSTRGTAIASASTCDIGAATGVFVHITGTTTITAFGTKTAGVRRTLVFDGALTLTHDGTSLILPTGDDIVTAAGDVAVMVSEGSGNWRCVDYMRASGAALALDGAADFNDAVTFSGVISPTALAANQDDYAPTGGAAARTIRLSASAAYAITGLSVSQAAGRQVVLVNVGSYDITLRAQNASSTAANRFAIDGDVVLEPNQSVTFGYDGTSSRWRPEDRVNAPALSPPGGRLTLTTATPVLTSDVTSATTIYYTPYRGLFFPCYNGTQTVMVSIGAELSLALASNSGYTGYHQSGKNFDLFLVKDAGTVRLVSGPAWTSDTARNAALAYKNGFLTNSASMTARFGSGSSDTITVAANEGLYVGTFRASADGTTLWTANPAAASGGGNARLFLWNMYNRVAVTATSRDSANTWNYTTATWRSANNSASNRISLVAGLADEPISAEYRAMLLNTSGAIGAVGVGVDSTSAVSGLSGNFRTSGANGRVSFSGTYDGYPGLGFHYLQALEYSEASGTSTWSGDDGDATLAQTGLRARWAA